MEFGPRVDFYGLGLTFGSPPKGNEGPSGSGVQIRPRLGVNAVLGDFSDF